jgi:hypothetical protein
MNNKKIMIINNLKNGLKEKVKIYGKKENNTFNKNNELEIYIKIEITPKLNLMFKNKCQCNFSFNK